LILFSEICEKNAVMATLVYNEEKQELVSKERELGFG